MGKIMQFLEQLTPRQVMGVFAVLVFPLLFAPYHGDDFFQLLILMKDPMIERGGDGSLFGLFSFVDDNPEHRAMMKRFGVIPWWAGEDYHFRFWRPLAELTHWLDYRVFGIQPVWAHLHSIAWFILACGLLWKLLETISPKHIGLTSLLAFALFVWDGQHVGAISWVANRSALIALVFGLAALLFHYQSAGHQKFFLYILALACFSLTLLSAEVGLSVLAYLLCCNMFLLREKSMQWKLASFIPYLIIALCYVYVHQSLGFGAETSNGYLNPLDDPVRFLLVSLQRFLYYLCSLFLPIPAGFSNAGEELWFTAPLMAVAGVLVLITIALLLKPFWADPFLKFAVYSTLLSVIPILAAPPQDRLTIFMTIGANITIAYLIVQYVLQRQENTEWKTKLVKGLVVIHVLLSPLHLIAGTTLMTIEPQKALNLALAMDEEQDFESRKLIVFEMPIGLAVSSMGMRKVMGEVLPESAFFVSNDEGDISYQLAGDHELVVERDIPFNKGFASMFRDVEEEPFLVGQYLEVGDLGVEILDVTPEGNVTAIKLISKEPWSSGGWIFYRFGQGLMSISEITH